jgi:small subunit ribosomal protein S8e
MGISRDSEHKRRKTGGKRIALRKKRQFALGRPAAATKIGTKRVRLVRCRGGNSKFRALRLESGNFSWGGESVSRKTRILGVVYNSSNNELVRTNTLVKNCIVQIDGTPFRTWYQQYYGVDLSSKDKSVADKDESSRAKAKRAKRRAIGEIDSHVASQFKVGRLYACISSRPGQSGRADGYILEGKELEFYLRKLQKKKR